MSNINKNLINFELASDFEFEIARKSTGGKAPRKSTGGKAPRKSTGGKAPRKSTGGKAPRKSTGGKAPRKSTGGKAPNLCVLRKERGSGVCGILQGICPCKCSCN